MNTYEVVFRTMDKVVVIQADRYCFEEKDCRVVSFFTGSDLVAERVGTFYMASYDYIRLTQTESDNNCSCSKECSKDKDRD
jgi:hypothetical protein